MASSLSTSICNQLGAATSTLKRRFRRAIRHGEFEFEFASGDTYPIHPWNVALTERSLLMDTKTGALLKVSVAEVGEENIEAGGKQVRAKKFVISGDLERELWYGLDDTWPQLRFDEDGAKITFTLQ